MRSLLGQIQYNLAPSEHFEHDVPQEPPPSTSIRALAFYLPQFHAIPENDQWWGRGFTEWTNTTKALPRFRGHYQPRTPSDLGFYDLNSVEILRQQAALARRYGIHGFCFHHYWFNGKRLLHKPLDNLLADPSIDLPFCINWANESWTRRWDGREDDLLVKQNHNHDDDLAFAESLKPLFADPRYIRINGRPLLLIYRPALMPDARETVERWRKHLNPYIAMVQTWGDNDPRKYGMDAAVCFPPFIASGGLRKRRRWFSNFRGEIFDYEKMASATLQSHSREYMVFPGVCPSWDNEARKPNRGIVFHGSTPAKYARWLNSACQQALDRDGDERIVFINAWNEWAEGAYLEPDRHFGFAYLNATRRVLGSEARPVLRGITSPPRGYCT